MDFKLGQYYTLPPGEEPKWFTQVLGRQRRIRVGDIWISIRLKDNSICTGKLHGEWEGDEHDSQGVVYLLEPHNEDDLSEIQAITIDGFTLLKKDTSLDRSDELRGNSP